MRTEMANLPGKCLRKHCRQFKLSVGKLVKSSFTVMATCPQVGKVLVVHAALEHRMFSGDVCTPVPSVYCDHAVH